MTGAQLSASAGIRRVDCQSVSRRPQRTAKGHRDRGGPAAGTARSAVGAAGAGMGSNPGAFPADGAWHNLAVTIDRTAGTAAAYIDGNQVAGSSTMRTDFPVSTPTDAKFAKPHSA